MKKLLLNKGRHEILIDDEDYSDVIEAKWMVITSGWTKQLYVVTGPRGGPWLYLHKYIMCPGEDQLVVFLNNNQLDFRKENLRLVSRSVRGQRREARPKSKSKYQGVTEQAGRWLSKICKDGKSVFLGSYGEEIHAARAYDIKAKELFGETAYHNNVSSDIVPIRYEFRITPERVEEKKT